jgi:hypothetical protein
LEEQPHLLLEFMYGRPTEDHRKALVAEMEVDKEIAEFYGRGEKIFSTEDHQERARSIVRQAKARIRVYAALLNFYLEDSRA